MADYAIHDTTLESIANTIRKKDGTSALIDPADYADRINLMGMLPEKTASSASICSFSDGADDVPMSSVIAHIAPNLTGKNAVNMKHTGKNLLLPENADISEATVNGIDRSYSLANREFTFSGTNTKTDENWLILNGSNWVIDGVKIGETYRFSHNLTADFYSQFTYNKSGGGVGSLGYLAGNAGQNASVSLTIPNDFVSFARFQIGVRSTAGAVNIVAHFQLEFGSSASSYEPYAEPTTYTANLGRTVYGADVDLVSGSGSEDGAVVTLDDTMSYGINLGTDTNRILVSFYNSVGKINGTFASNVLTVGENTSGGYKTEPWVIWGSTSAARMWISVPTTIDTVDKFKQYLQSNTITIAYELATGTSFTFDGQEIPSLLGVNNLWHDAGETEVTYRADIDLALAQSSGTRGLMMASRSVSPMIGEEASLDRENILEEVSDYSDNEEEVNENEQNESY